MNPGVKKWNRSNFGSIFLEGSKKDESLAVEVKAATSN
jgi:hypothetical protein